MSSRQGILQGVTRAQLVDGKQVAVAKKLGLSQSVVAQRRQRGIIYSSAKAASVAVREKIIDLLSVRGHLLTERQREVIRLFYCLDGDANVSRMLSVTEVANKLEISKPAVTYHLARARVRLHRAPSAAMMADLRQGPAWLRLTLIQRKIVDMHHGFGNWSEEHNFAEIARHLSLNGKRWIRSSVFNAYTLALDHLLFDR